LRTGKTILPLQGHAKQLLAIDFHPDNRHVATGSDDHAIRIWDLRHTRSCIYTIPAHNNLISNVRWDQLTGGEYLLSSSYDQTVKVWDGHSFLLQRTLKGHEGRITRVELAPNNSCLATTSFDRTWKTWAIE
jgi:U4/U6 small nuclear ribonucleoprotein PRP4